MKLPKIIMVTMQNSFLELFVAFNNSDILLASIIPIKIYSNSDLNKVSIIEENKGQAGVYRWVNILTGEFYIGSSTNLSKRLQQYYQYSYISSPDRGQSKIYSSILKYGYSNFSLEILEYCEIENTIDREQFYIDTMKPDLNILPTAGNSLGYKHTGKSLKKMSTLKKDIYLGENNPFYGKSHTDEIRLLQKERALARSKSPNAKSVILTDSNHKTIQEFKSMLALSFYLKADRAKLAQYRISGELFRGLYYIKPLNK
jgi:group I intron endonuclease